LNVALPKNLLSSLEKIPSFNRTAFEEIHASGEQVVSVRVNPLKTGSHELDSLVTVERVPWSTHGYYLKERPSFTLDPFFHAGAYYVQEASGMFVEQALRQTADLDSRLRVLDLCAAPGGKSTLLQSLLSADSLLVSNELIRSRVSVLYQNLTRWGGSNGIVTNSDPHHFNRFPDYFDIILADAPCSGSGLFRKDPEAILEWTPENVLLCSRRQERILADCWPALKKNGILIYATCSYSTEENEDQVDYLLERFDSESVRLSIDPDWQIAETRSGKRGGYGYRFYPDRLKGEGFFLSCIRKLERGNAFYNERHKAKYPDKQTLGAIRKYIPDEPGRCFLEHNGLLYAIPETCTPDFYLLQSLYLKKAGVLIGKMAGGEIIPDHELALSRLSGNDIPVHPVSLEQALKYLRKEDFNIEGSQKGWGLVQFRHQSIGWVKFLPNRINNYYPKSWRILQ
jgi:16S rRNA C967 or C1407 C5-methylase (RsmB/RsmF family)/NOL1/NOP2/fmu family ribosome biogenesis protein